MLGTKTHHFLWRDFYQEALRISKTTVPPPPPPSPNSLQGRVHRPKLPSSSTISQLVYLQETGAILRNPKWQVLCHRSKRTEVAGWCGCIKLGGISPGTREEVTQATSQSSALLYPGGLFKPSLHPGLTHWLPSPPARSCCSLNCSAELVDRLLVSR